jgi:16S rRNA (guanine(1405)-N(7))-methyltransferase
VDVVLLLKTLPCLEQQEKGASLRLLQSLRTRFVVVSFPRGSLGGRDKGMHENYSQFIRGIAGEMQVPFKAVETRTEDFYVLDLRRGSW